MGDVVQAAGAYHDVRDHHPDAMITILTGPLYKELIERCVANTRYDRSM